MDENLKKFYKTYHYIIRKLWTVDFALALVAILMGYDKWAIGFLVGGAAAHFFFYRLRKDIEKMAARQNFSTGQAFAGHLFRYVGVGVIFALAISSGFANMWSIFIGFFVFHLILFMIKFGEKEKKE